MSMKPMSLISCLQVPATARTGTATSHSRVPTRPQTGRPQTAISSRPEGSYVLALLESRGVNREIGIAALEKHTGRVNLIQLADCQTYVKSLHHIDLHYPQTILVPDSSIGPTSNKPAASLLLDYIREEFPAVCIEPVLRKYWNETAGLEFINQLCVENDERAATLLAVSNKYYALSAACALFKHAEAKLNIRYSSQSLRIKYTPVEGTMLIDYDTARNLELAGNITAKRSSRSLIGLLNHTFTPMATRLLRINILAPITVRSSIEARLDAVDELVQTEHRFSGIRDALKGITGLDFDKLIASMVASEARETSTAKSAASRVSQMLNLRNLLRAIPTIRQSLEGVSGALLRIICRMLEDERLCDLEGLISGSLNEDAIPQKGGGLTAMNTRVYAVKANYNRLLDVARETYKENIGDILQLTNAVSEEHSLPLQALYQDNGFVFCLKKTDVEDDFPKGFINITSKGQKWYFSSVELKKRNARLRDALEEALMLSAKTINDLVARIVSNVGALYMASEAIALLDMLWSFAHSSILRNYVRPEFTGTLAIKSGRHPILERVQMAGHVVPNDVYCSDSSSFQLVRGANMSGKSTYLRQIALLAIMAMCGCFVPAEYASFRIHDALLTRLSNDDDMEKSLSTFSSEMASSAMILGLATSDSLVLIDELGRGTSPREGIGISHAIAECLIGIKAFTFFATHFSDLSATLSRHPSVVQLHLSTQKSKRTTSNFGLLFNHKIIDGPPDDLDHYGLELARLADLPEDVQIEATTVANKLMAGERSHRAQSQTSRVGLRRKAMLRLRMQLAQVAAHSRLPEEDLLQYLLTIQNNFVQVLGTALEEDSVWTSSKI